MSGASRMLGLWVRRERWGLSGRGWVAALLGGFCLVVGLLRGAHPFLAPSDPGSGGVLVVEGWIPKYAVGKCAELFKAGGYRKIYTVGGPVSGAPDPASDDDTYAYVAAEHLRKMGFGGETVEMAPTRVSDRDRTYASAVALRERLERDGPFPEELTVATLGVHARRTRLLYEKAFGGRSRIGVMAIENRDYDGRRWWRQSEGVKEVLSEGIAYLYARVLFHP